MSVQYQVKSTSYLALDLQLPQLERGIKLVSVSTVSISMNHDVLLMPIKLYRNVTVVSLVVFQCTIHPTSVQFLDANFTCVSWEYSRTWNTNLSFHVNKGR